jgi:hypothetical protein
MQIPIKVRVHTHDIMPNHILQDPVNPFGLTISLWMKSSGTVVPSSENSEKLREELAYKDRSSITDDIQRDTMMLPHIINKKTCSPSSIHSRGGRNNMSHFCKPVHDN